MAKILVLYYSSWGHMEAMAKAAPWLKRMINFGDLDDIEQARDNGASIIEFNAADVTDARLEQARACGLEIMIYTPENDLTAFRTAIQWRVDYLNTDFPEIASRLRADG